MAAALVAACNGDKTTTLVAPRGPGERPSFSSSSNAGVNLDQWANGTATTAASWQNGNLNGNNSTYGEGKVVPFRLAVEGLSSGQHFITIQHDFTSGGSKAYDFLTNADATETTIFDSICSGGGGGVSSLCGASNGAMPGTVAHVDVDYLTDTFAGPAGKTVEGAIAASTTKGTRKLRIYGISNLGQVSLSQISHTGDFTHNSTAQFLVTFTPDVAGPVLLVWGGHLAESGYWDGPLPKGSSTISGSPWHMRTLNLDNGGASNQDRSIQPSALVPPVLTITKVANPTGPVSAGTDIGFDITVTNTGPGSAFNVVINDALPGKTGISWTTATVGCAVTGTAPTQTLACDGTNQSFLNTMLQGASFTARVTSHTTGVCGLITNSGATASATNSAQVMSGPASVTVNCAAVSISKSAVSGIVSAGDPISFDITLLNGGAAPATVGFTDTPPNVGGTWTIAAGDPDHKCTFNSETGTLTCSGITLAATNGSYTVRITSGTTTAACGTVHNTATLSGPLTDFSTASVVVNCPNVGIAKTAVNATVNAGGSVAFDIVVSNTGLGTAYGVGFTDVLPNFGGTWSIPSQDGTACSISSGAPITMTCSGITLPASTGSYTVRVTTGTDGSVCAAVQNTANLSSPYSGSNQASVTVNCPNVSIGKTAVSSTVNAGANVMFDIVASNTGAAPASNVGFTDVLPNFGGTWSIASQDGSACSISSGPPIMMTCSGITLAASTGSYKVRVQSTTDGSVCTAVRNTVNLTTPYSGSANDAVTVNCPHITILKTAGSATVNTGEDVTFGITVSNTGLGSASNVAFTDALPSAPAGLTWSITSDPGPRCTLTGNALSCTGISLAATTGSYTVGVKATTTALTTCGLVSNTASLSSPYSGSSLATVTVTCPASKLNVLKFYDANGDGVQNNGEPYISGWKMLVTGTGAAAGYTFTGLTAVALSTNDATPLKIGGYTVTEFASKTGSWNQTGVNWTNGPPSASGSGGSVTLTTGQEATVTFGNVCTTGGAGLTLGFWSNQNGQSQMGGNTGVQWLAVTATPAPIAFRNGDGTLANWKVTTTDKKTGITTTTYAYSAFNSWLLSGNATNMAYMLSVQLAAMELNVQYGGGQFGNGKVPAGQLVYAPLLKPYYGTTVSGLSVNVSATGYITVGDLMTAAANALANPNGNTVATSAIRSYQEALKTTLDVLNNGKQNYVSATPCAFSF